MKKVATFFSLVVITVIAVTGLGMPIAQAAFNQNLIIDDTVFNDTGSMNSATIDNWLNVNFPQSCISPNSGFRARVPSGYSPSGGFTYGGFGTAGEVIATSAGVYGLNPQVLLVTLQKEQSLVAGGSSYCNDGDEHKYAAAMGYGCPDSGTVHSYTGVSLYMRNGVEHTSTGSTCVNSAAAAGFSQQVIRAAWLLKFGQQRSLGNTGWAIVSGSWDNSDDPPTCYGGPMTQGVLSRGCGQAATFYDGYSTIDSTAVHMDSGATAALYWYTPHFHGNQVFYNNFTAWFGNTISAGYYSCHGASNVTGAVTGERVIGSKLGINHTDNLRLVIPNNTGSSCIEVHTWQNNNYQSWIQHIATNSPAANPASQRIVSTDGNGDGIDEVYKVDYTGTGSGMIELHVWDGSVQKWIAHVATNRPSLSLADAEVIMADTDGDGRDSTFLVQYRNTGSGSVEVHQWNSNLQQWVSHIATNYGVVDPASAQVIAADLNGDGRDEFYLVNYSGSSGRIELHGWTSNFQQWVSHIATVSPDVTHVDGSGNPISDVIAADTNGNSQDELYKVDYSGTASSRLEIHGWTPNLQQWSSHVATNQGAF
jgi:hypothetical protein